MYAKDQANTTERKEIRDAVFKENYEELINLYEKNQFPIVTAEDLFTSDSCRFLLVSITFTHIAQSDPTYFFSRKNRIFIKKLYVNYGLEHEIIRNASEASSLTNELCENLKADVEKSLEEWEINDTKEKFKYIKCDK